MIIKTLVENTSILEGIASEHGLSLYVETKNYKILFDVGESNLFLENAEKLDVNISEIDYLIISHGHYDHGGGLRRFLQENTKAEVFIHDLAFEKHYALRSNDEIEYIGLDEDLKTDKRIIYTSDKFFINKGLYVFSNITQKEPLPKSNSGLLTKNDGQMVDDIFLHEQNLVIEEDDEIVLITGCAHNGIVNIIKHFYDIRGLMPSHVIGGFHLSSKSTGNENTETIDKIAEYLIDTDAKYYTCHCTGIEPYKQLKTIMSDKIDYLKTGSVITI
ncbi:MAG: MBL fold metallo-hydrolase [Tissierellia bacterium]|nr:MBL fold metallo-hydrolase [Tissierellia bacterium]